MSTATATTARGAVPGSEGRGGPGFDEADRRANAARDGFDTSVDCDDASEKATAAASGSGRSEALEQAAGFSEPVRVTHASSKVTVSRDLGEGVTVKVDSVAPGGGDPRGGHHRGGPGRGDLDGHRARPGARASFKRTICDVDAGALVVPGCVGEGQQQALVEGINKALGDRGEVRLRRPDDVLAAGSRHGTWPASSAIASTPSPTRRSPATGPSPCPPSR